MNPIKIPYNNDSMDGNIDIDKLRVFFSILFMYIKKGILNKIPTNILGST